MSATITVVAGPARSGKTARLLHGYRRVLAEGPPGAALWLAPAHRAAVGVRERILSDRVPGCLEPHCLTFDQFARRVLDASPLDIRPISLLQQREILARLIDDAMRDEALRYFAPISRTPGFLDLLVGFVQELKRLEVWPEELRGAVGANSSPKNRELCDLYEQYQHILTKHDLYDAQGRFWSARAELRDGQSRPFDALRHVFVDGFFDFTRTEHEILEILAGRALSLTISLPLETGSPRADLFAKSAGTLAELRRRHTNLAVEEIARPPTSWPALDHVERFLFANPRQIAPPPDPAGIEIVAAAGVTNEIEQLARRIKKLLVEGDGGAVAPSPLMDFGELSRAGEGPKHSPAPLMGEGRGEGDGPSLGVAPSPGVAALRHPLPRGERGRGEERGPIRPGDVLVVFRSLTDTAELVREVFDEFGIPVVIGSRPQLERAGIARALAAWLRLDLEDWPFRQLLALVVHDYFRPAWPEWRDARAGWAAEHVVRRLQIPSGRSALLAQLEFLATRGGDSRREPDGPPSLLERQAQLAWPLVQRIGKLLDALPQRATLSVWTRAVTELAKEAGILQSPEHSGAASELARADHLAWEQLVRGLHESEHLSSWLGRPPAELSRREFFEHFQEVLRSVPLAIEQDEAGRVRVLAAESARHVTAPYVFVAGLSERAFPPADREDCLYSEAETRELVAAGLPLAPRAQRRQHEMLLFYQVAMRATRRLVLSYPALDAAAQPLSPSPYLREIERLFAPGALVRGGPPNLSSVPPTDAVFSPREFRVRAVERALEGDDTLLTRLAKYPSTAIAADNILAGLHAASLRKRGAAFGPFEGIFTSDAALALVGERFGAQRCWSPSQLEQYALCPYQFFMARVLGLEPIEDPVLAVDYSGRGRMLHSLLAELHRGLNERAGGHASPSDLTEQQIAERISELAAELLARLKTNRPLADGLLEIDVRRLSASLADYWRQHAGYDAASAGWEAPLRPAHFEVAFGPRSGRDDADATLDTDDPLSTREPFELACSGETIRFAGRIDRVDIGSVADQAVFSIIDYKSGRSESAKAKAILEGLVLQLPLYALAAEKLLAAWRAIPVRVGYWHVAGKGCKETIALHEHADGELRPSPEWELLMRELPARIRSLVRGIRQGQFPMASADDMCTSHCPYSTVCRVNQARALGKQWQPPREDAP